MNVDRYTRDPVAFIDAFIPLNEKGKPWRLAAYQRRVLALAFRWQQRGQGHEVRLCLRLLLWSEPKKSGKTFLAACLGLWWTFVTASTECTVVANDFDQAQGRVFATMVALCRHNAHLAGSVTVRSADIQVSNGSVIKAVANDYRGEAGGRQSLTIFDELWAFDSERARRLYEELTPPPSEPDAWVLVVTYAGFTGESDLLEGIYTRGLAGDRVDEDLEVYVAGEQFTFWSHTPRQPWQTPEYYAEQRRSLRPATFARIHENRWVSAESTFISPELWDPCVDAALTPLLSDNSYRVFVGVDAAQKHDCAAVAAVAWEDGKLRLVFHKIWRPSPTEPLDLEATIEAELKSLYARFTVRLVVTDPWQMARSIATLKAGGMPIEELPQTLPNLTAMGSALYEALRGRNLRLYPDAELRQQAFNTIAVDSARGWKISKEKASRKIDAIVALGMACYAAIREGEFGAGEGFLAYAAGRLATMRAEAGAARPTHDTCGPKISIGLDGRCKNCGSLIAAPQSGADAESNPWISESFNNT